MKATTNKILLGHPTKTYGYTTLDFAGSPDRNFDLNEPLDYDPGSFEEVAAYHVIEHLHPGRVKFWCGRGWSVSRKGGGSSSRHPTLTD